MDEYKQKLNTLTLKMQFFCLDPQYSDFVEICNSTKLKNEQGTNFDIWRLATISKYGFEDNKLIIQRFNTLVKRITSRMIIRPTTGYLDRLWYVFFATGEYQYLEYLFKAAGNESATAEFRDIAIDRYQTFTNEYKKKIKEGLEKCRDSEGIKHLDRVRRVFDQLQKSIDEKTKELNESRSNSDNLRQNVKELQDIVKDMQSKANIHGTKGKTNLKDLTPEDVMVDEAKNIFDDIVNDVFSKV